MFSLSFHKSPALGARDSRGGSGRGRARKGCGNLSESPCLPHPASRVRLRSAELGAAPRSQAQPARSWAGRVGELQTGARLTGLSHTVGSRKFAEPAWSGFKLGTSWSTRAFSGIGSESLPRCGSRVPRRLLAPASRPVLPLAAGGLPRGNVEGRAEVSGPAAGGRRESATACCASGATKRRPTWPREAAVCLSLPCVTAPGHLLPYLDLRSRWRLSFRSLTIPEEARVRGSAGGLQPRKLIASMWLKRCTGPAPGPPSRVSPGAGPQVRPGRLALRAAFLGQGALCLATRAPHVAK